MFNFNSQNLQVHFYRMLLHFFVSLIPAANLLNFRPLVLKMPSPRALRSQQEHSLGIEELRRSPSIEVEAIELEKQMHSAEQHLDAKIAIATAEESDNEEVRII